MPTLKNAIRTAFPMLSFLALGASTALGGVGLTRSGGVLGQSLKYDLVGDPGELYALLPSTNTGPTALSIIDPLDGRSLEVGLDLISMLRVGSLGPLGQASLSFPLPANPALSGVSVHAQLMTIPGVTTVIDEISKLNSVKLGFHGESFLSIGNLPVATAGYGSAALPNGGVLLGGGSVADALGNGVPQDALRMFDPGAQAFKTLAVKMSYAAITPVAVSLSDGRVLFCGGVGANDSVLSNASIFDPATGLASAVASMPGPRSQHTATLMNDGRVFVVGGVKGLNSADPVAGLSEVLSTSAIYDPVANNWSSGPSLPFPRVGQNASLLPSGRVLITGGLEIANLFGFPLPAIVDTCRRYDPVNNSLSVVPSFNGKRALHGQVTLADGRVLLVGGANGDVIAQNFFSLDTCRVYDEGSNSWSNVTSLPEVRTFPSVIEIAGKVHVLSGVGTIDLTTLSGTSVTNIVASDPTTFGWASTGSMVYPRGLSSSLAIEGGELVLTLGPGDNGLGTDDLSAEVYIP